MKVKTKQHSNVINKSIDKKEEGDTMKKEHCVCCIEGLQALQQRLERNDYVRLENLALCDTCRGRLLVSIEDERMREKSEGECDEQQQG